MKNAIPVPVGPLASGRVRALDAPFAGDAMGHQLGNSDAVVIARYETSTPEFHQLVAVEKIAGALGTLINLRRSCDEHADKLPYARGAAYLLFLRHTRIADEYCAPLGLYPVCRADPADAAKYREAYECYQAGSDAGFKSGLLKLSTSSIAYLQYSAIADLSMRALIGADNLAAFARMLTDGVVATIEARRIIIEEIGRSGTRKFNDVLGSLVKDSKTPLDERIAALNALAATGGFRCIVQPQSTKKNNRSSQPRIQACEAHPE